MDTELAAILCAPPEPERPYVYRGTRCHINNFDILNPLALEKVVRCVSDLRTQLFWANPIPGNYDLAHLQAIHQLLFQDVYDWAGQLRVVDFSSNAAPISQISEDNKEIDQLVKGYQAQVLFSNAEIIKADCDSLFADLANESYLRGLNRPCFVERATRFFKRLFIVHPFRDGNGRTIRIFFQLLGRAAGWELDFDSTTQIQRHLAAYLAHCGDDTALREFVEQSVKGPWVPEFLQEVSPVL
jgi:cell filamentation protein